MRHKLKDVSTGLIAGMIVCGLCNPLFMCQLTLLFKIGIIKERSKQVKVLINKWKWFWNHKDTAEIIIFLSKSRVSMRFTNSAFCFLYITCLEDMDNIFIKHDPAGNIKMVKEKSTEKSMDLLLRLLLLTEQSGKGRLNPKTSLSYTQDVSAQQYIRKRPNYSHSHSTFRRLFIAVNQCIMVS